MTDQNETEKPKTRWHRLLSRMLTEILTPVGIEVFPEQEIISDSPRLDILLVKKNEGRWSPEQLERLPDGIKNSRASHILLEFKYSESVNDSVFGQAYCYNKYYRRSRKLEAGEVQTFLISSKTTRKAMLAKFGYSRSKTPGVYLSDHPFVERISLLSLNELANKPCNAFLKCFASRKKEKIKAFSMLRHWKSWITSADFWQFIHGLGKICLIKGGDEMKEITPETLIEMGKEMEKVFLANLPIEKLLKEFDTREILKGIKPEERLKGLKPKERLEGLKPEERLKGLKPKERLKGLKPEERLEGLKPEEIEALFEKYKKKSK